MQRKVNKQDNFKIRMQDLLFDNAYEVIFMLYQPLIGAHATNLYITLLLEKKLTSRINLSFNHERLMHLLAIDNDQLLITIITLENNNLLTSYYNTIDGSYLYKLIPPLTPQYFFANKIFAKNLEAKIGTLNFERQKFYFNCPETTIEEDLVDITSGYLAIDNNKENKQSILGRNNINSSLLSNNFVNTASHRPAQINLDTRSANVVSSKSNSINLQRTLWSMQQQSPESYIENLTQKPVDDKLRQILKMLKSKFFLNYEVINCLIEYVWFKNDKRLETNYILKIGDTFKKNKINNVSDALNHLKLAYSKSKNRNFTGHAYKQDVLWSSDTNYIINDNISYLEQNQSLANEANNIVAEDEIIPPEELERMLEELDNYDNN